MKKVFEFTRKIEPRLPQDILAASLVFAIAVAMYRNVEIINPWNLRWIEQSGDVASFWLNSLAFRLQPISWPFGANPQYCGNILYSEVIGAIFAKLVNLSFYTSSSSTNAAMWQPFGTISFLFLYLLCLFSYKCLILLGNSKKHSLIATTIIATCPIVVQRTILWHIFTGAFFILSASCYVYIISLTKLKERKKIPWLGWCLLATIAFIIHPYLVIMPWVFFASYSILFHSSGIKVTERSWLYILKTIIYVFSIPLMMPIYLLTGTLIPDRSTGASDLGKYHSNILSLFDSNGLYSMLLPDIKTLNDGHDYEGFAFLGLGLLGAGLIVILLYIVNRHSRKGGGTIFHQYITAKHLLLPFGILYALGTGGHFAIANTSIFDLTQNINGISFFSTFRASGRYASASALLLTIIILAVLTSFLSAKSKRLATFVLLIIFFVQAVDMQNAYKKNALQESITAEASNDSSYTTNSFENVDFGKIRTVEIAFPENSMYLWKMHVVQKMLVNRIPNQDSFCGREDTMANIKRKLDVNARFASLSKPDASSIYIFYPHIEDKIASLDHSSHIKISSEGAVIYIPKSALKHFSV